MYHNISRREEGENKPFYCLNLHDRRYYHYPTIECLEYEGKRKTYTSDAFESGDIVIMELNVNVEGKSCLEYHLNSRDLGIAFDQIDFDDENEYDSCIFVAG